MSQQSDLVTFNVSMDRADKKFLKQYAVAHDISVAELIRRYVEMLRQEEEEQKS